MDRGVGARRIRALFVLLAVASASSARADEEAPPPPPYSLPWQLRSAFAATVVRADTALAEYEDTASRRGLTVASTLTASYKIPTTGARGEGLAPLVRLALVDDSPPSGSGGFAIVNPLVGVAYAMRIAGPLRASFSFGATVPVGMGGGDSPDPALASVRTHGQFARSEMDNSLFAVNDLAIIPGVDFAYVARGFTAQIEATVFQLQRVRGAAVQAEASKTNFTTGLHLGWFPLPELSLGAELHYQRWLDAPIAIDHDASGTLVDNWTFAVGPRLHMRAGDVWVRPGLAYERGLDKPMAAAAPNYHIVLLDVPVFF